MSKALPDDVLDAPLEDVADNGDLMILCSAQPTTYTEATVTYALADVAMTTGDGNGDYTIADGTTGRKLTVSSKSGVTVDATGTATHIAIVDDTNDVIKLVTTCTSQAVTAATTVTINSFEWTNADPT